MVQMINDGYLHFVLSAPRRYKYFIADFCFCLDESCRGMQDHCYVKRFTFDQAFQSYEIDQFLLDFFHNNPHIKVSSSGDRWATLGKVTQVTKEETLHSVTSLSFFDRLKKGTLDCLFLCISESCNNPPFKKDIVRSNGDIKKCLDEYYDNFLVSDQLRKCLLMQEFEEYDLFSATDRQEFIFHLFKSLCLGGRLCQVFPTF
jgi:hypothetical protein